MTIRSVGRKSSAGALCRSPTRGRCSAASATTCKTNRRSRRRRRALQNDCLTLAVTYEQSNIQDRDIEPEQRVMVNLALKYLGTYQTQTDAFGAFGAEASNTND